MQSFGQPTVCPKCSKQVYMAEQVLGPGRKIYHKYCFKCTNCNKRLDSNFVEHDEDPFCRQCHRNNFGIKDLRSANISPEPIKDLKLPPPSSISDTGEGDVTEDLDSINVSLETRDSFPTNLNTSLSGGVSSSPFHSPVRQQTTGGVGYNGNRSPLTANFTGGMFARSGTFARTPNTFGSSPTCPRCGKAVYFAEQVNAIGKKWHKACLTCSSCRKRLDSYTLQEHDEEPYCKSCHIRNFGTRDLRSANLSPTTST